MPHCEPMGIDVSLFAGDINDADADFGVVPVDARLRCDRNAARTVIAACDAGVADGLRRMAEAIPTGVAPGAVIIVPALGHRRFQALALVVLFDNRAEVEAKKVEPDDERIALAARALWRVLDEDGAGSVALTSLAGRIVDAGEAAATTVRMNPGTTTRQVIFVERDPIFRSDVNAAIESIGVSVRST